MSLMSIFLKSIIDLLSFSFILILSSCESPFCEGNSLVERLYFWYEDLCLYFYVWPVIGFSFTLIELFLMGALIDLFTETERI